MTPPTGAHGEHHAPAQPKPLACAETWAGNKETSGLVALPGLTAWVHSSPAGQDGAGGDVHYVSVCPSCTVSRIALADVSGHGQAVAMLAEMLRELMQRHLRTLEQVALMRDLNRALRTEMGDGHYATMVALGWHRHHARLVLTNAGHPPPLLYRASRNEWSWLVDPDGGTNDRPVGVPLGLLPDTVYARMVVTPQPGDVVLLYSDGVSDATSASGRELGRDGLMEMVHALDCHSAQVAGSQLAAALQAFRCGSARTDDETIIVIRVDDVRAP